MRDKWKIIAKVEYECRETAIREFEHIIEILKNTGYRKGGGGNSAAEHWVTGPTEPPLTDIEIARLRAMIS